MTLLILLAWIATSLLAALVIYGALRMSGLINKENDHE